MEDMQGQSYGKGYDTGDRDASGSCKAGDGRVEMVFSLLGLCAMSKKFRLV